MAKDSPSRLARFLFILLGLLLLGAAWVWPHEQLRKALK